MSCSSQIWIFDQKKQNTTVSADKREPIQVADEAIPSALLTALLPHIQKDFQYSRKGEQLLLRNCNSNNFLSPLILKTYLFWEKDCYRRESCELFKEKN